LTYSVNGTPFFWATPEMVFRPHEFHEEVRLLAKERRQIMSLIEEGIGELGCGIAKAPVIMASMRGIGDREASTIRGLANKADVVLDFTLLGISNYEGGPQGQELLSGPARGADIHNMDLDSLIEGAMAEDFSRMAERIGTVQLMLQGARHMDIVAPGGTNVRLPLILTSSFLGRRLGAASDLLARFQVPSACRFPPVARGTGIIGKGQWHFLPNGILSLCVNHTAVRGKLGVQGPVWGILSKGEGPFHIEVEARSGALALDMGVHHHLLRHFLESGDGAYIGELTLGFNTAADRDSEVPYEFYVADANVTIAFGQNRHLGGRNPDKLVGRLVPIYHTHWLVKSASVTVQRSDGSSCQIISEGKWTVNEYEDK